MLRSRPVPDPIFTVIDGRRVWRFPDGVTVPYVSGGAGDEPAPEPAPEPAAEPAPEPAPEPASEPAPEPTDPPLGPKGEKALDEWKRRAREAEAKLKEHENANLSEQERAVAEARTEGEAAARAAMNSRLFAAELKAASKGLMNDQALSDLATDADSAMRQLGLSEIPVTEDGDIDSEAISQAVDAYVTARPYLAEGATPLPGIDQGSRTPPPTKTIADAIAEAEAEGNWQLSRQLKSQLTFAKKS